MRREVTRVVTPGTITEDDLLDPRQNNHLVSLHPGHARTHAGLAWLELSTGQFHAADVPWPRLADELARLAPAECLCAEAQCQLLGDILIAVDDPARPDDPARLDVRPRVQRKRRCANILAC